MKYQKAVDEEYITIDQHESIVNEQIEKFQAEKETEIQEICDKMEEEVNAVGVKFELAESQTKSDHKTVIGVLRRENEKLQE